MLCNSTSPTSHQNDILPTSTRLVFIAGWGEELFAVSRRIQRFVTSTSRVTVPDRFLYESLRGDAIYLTQCPGFDQPAELGQGLLLDPHPDQDIFAFLREFSQQSSDKMISVKVKYLGNGEEVEALSFAKHFPKSHVPACIIPCGQWLLRPLPFPLVNLSAEALGQVRHIFAYGTLRFDDTSGASWTKPFNEDMESEHACVRGVSLYLQTFPIVLIPRHEEHSNEGAIGCCVSTDNDELFGQKLALADRIEGWPSLYRRGVVRAQTKSGKEVFSFIYYRTLRQIGGDTERFLKSRIPSGNFLRRGATFAFETVIT
jgi:gamma-glutamylcyclotransferase (GGCT)/AIG2-like uncharacterized protein YtfP